MAVDVGLSFKCTVLSPNQLIFEREIQSLFVTSDRGEFEILAYHYPVIAMLPKGDIVINQAERVEIKGGVLRFFANECTILVEEDINKPKVKV